MVEAGFRQISDENLRVYVKSQIDKGHSLVLIREFLVKQSFDPNQVSQVLESFNQSSGLSHFDNSSHHESFFAHHKLLIFAAIFVFSIFVVFLFLNSIGQEPSFSDEVTLSVVESDISPVLGLDSDYVSLTNVTYSTKGNSLFFSVDKNIDSGILSESDLFVYFSNDDESQSLMIPIDDSFNLKNGRFKFDSNYLKNYPNLDFSIFSNAQLVVRQKPKPVDVVVIDDPDVSVIVDDTVVDNNFSNNNSTDSSGVLSGGSSGGSSGGDTTTTVDDISNNSTLNVTTNVSQNVSQNVTQNITQNITINITDGIDNLSLQVSSSFFGFDESSGNLVFDNNGFSSLLSGNVTFVNSDIFGSALNFSKTGYVNVSNLSVFDNNLSELTISFWIKPQNISNQGYQGIVFHGHNNTLVDTFAIYLKPDQRLIGFKTTGTTPSSWMQAINLDLFDCNWHNVVATYDGSVKSLYVDGILVGSVSASGIIASGNDYSLLFGVGREYIDLPYEGLLDEVSLYNYSMSLSEITNSYSFYNYSLSDCSIQEVVVDPCPSGFCYEEGSLDLDFAGTYTLEELNMWRTRSIDGPFKLSQDSFVGSPGEWDRIVSSASSFPSQKDSIILNGTCIPLEDIVTISAGTFQKSGISRDAAFFDLVEDSNVYTADLKYFLLAQTSRPCMDFSDRYYFPYHNKDSVWLYGEWLHTLLLTYDYLGSDVFTLAEKNQIDDWFKAAADWMYYIPTTRTIDNVYISREGLPEDYVLDTSYWLNDGVGKQVYQGSTFFHAPGTMHNNRLFGITNFVTHAGVMFDNSTWKEIGAKAVREYVSFHFDDNGYYAELLRSTQTNPEYGLAYGGNTLINVAEIAHILYLDGYTNLYEYNSNMKIDPSTGYLVHGTVNKSLEWVALKFRENFMELDATPIYSLGYTGSDISQLIHFCLNSDMQKYTVRYYASLSMLNNYYKNDLIKDMYASEDGNLCDYIGIGELRQGPLGVSPGSLFQYSGLSD